MVTQGKFIVFGVPGWVPPARRKILMESNPTKALTQPPLNGAAPPGPASAWGGLTLEGRLQMLEVFVDEIGGRLAQLEGLVFSLKHSLPARELNAGCAPAVAGQAVHDASDA